MTIDSNYELTTSDELDLNDDEPPSDLNSSVTDFDTQTEPNKNTSSKSRNTRNFEAQKKIEQLQEERRLKKLIEDNYDDWD